MKSGTAKKKPIPVNFLYYDGEISTIVAWCESFNDSAGVSFGIVNKPEERHGSVIVRKEVVCKTKEGNSYTLEPNQNVIMRGGKDEYWPIQVDIFERTYDIESIEA